VALPSPAEPADVAEEDYGEEAGTGVSCKVGCSILETAAGN
jgi:hypothetical protein